MDSPTLVTVGHGTLGADGLIDLLRAGRIAALVDGRRYPGRRRCTPAGARPTAARTLVYDRS